MGGRTRPGPRWVLTSPLPIHTRAPEFPMGLAKKSELRGNQEVAGNRRHSLTRVVVPLPGLLLQDSAGLGSCCRWTPGFEKGARFGHHWPPVLRRPPLLARIARVPCAHLVRGMRTSGASFSGGQSGAPRGACASWRRHVLPCRPPLWDLGPLHRPGSERGGSRGPWTQTGSSGVR